MKYETAIGLEVHVELLTKTKIFCGCKNAFGALVNTHCCPVCMGLPGALPVLNNKVVELAVKVGLATNCQISVMSLMDRKNYFYPDNPKSFQISQHEFPLCNKGYLEIEVAGKTKKIRINRIHIEEDAGKLSHTEGDSDYSLVDYNRAGVPLIEIVSEPDMRTPAESKLYLEKLKSILEYLEVSDCKMQEGSLRCDANISIMTEGAAALGTKVEIKNMNSFKALEKALEYEQCRQIEVLNKNERIISEARRWDDVEGISIAMRSKEQAHDYRYFPEPDLMPIILEMNRIEEIRAAIPELPHDKKKRFIEQYQLPAYDAMVLTSSKALAEFYEECLIGYNNPKTVSNWVMGELLRILNERRLIIEDIKFSSSELIELLKLVDNSTISGTAAKQVLEAMFEYGKSPKVLIAELGLEQVNDEDAITGIVRKIIEENPDSVKAYKFGKYKAIDFMVGQSLRALKGKGNPQIINKIIKDLLDKM